MVKCKICGNEYRSNSALSDHINKIHNIDYFSYKKKFDNLDIPKCPYCGNTVEKRVGGGIRFYKTCRSEECLKKDRKKSMSKPITRDKIRKARLAYMKNHPEETAWRQRNSPSFPEYRFLKELEKREWNLKVIREKSFYPFYVDFAFPEIYLAVEIDGSQHNLPDYKERDRQKEKILKGKGWSLYRIPAINIMRYPDRTMGGLEDFIKFNMRNIPIIKKNETYPEIKKEVEIKKAKDELKRKNRVIKYNRVKEKRLKDIRNEDLSKRGWQVKLAKKWGLSHTQVRRFIKKEFSEYLK